MGKKSVVIDTTGYDSTTKTKIYEVTKANGETLDQIIHVGEETQKIGKKAQSDLAHQGQQIDGLTNDLQDLSVDIEKSKRSMRSIRSVFGTLWNFLTCCCTKSPADRSKNNTTSYHSQEPVMLNEIPNGDTTVTYLFDSQTQQLANENSDKINQVVDITGDLLSQANGFSKTLDHQIGDLKKAEAGVDENNAELEQIGNEANKILRKKSTSNRK